jgi:ribosomal protein S8
MSQDVVSDALNQIMNAKKAKKKEVIIKRHSKLLISILELVKDSGYLDYKIENNELRIEIKNIREIKAVKPRYSVSVKKINHYVRRFLPSKNFGFVIISTNKGLVKHGDAEEKNMGGCIVAYVF